VNAGRFRFFRRRMGQDVRAWPMLALLLLIVAAAIGCVLWFMREAVRNERLAVRQKLADAYRGQLALVEQRVGTLWSGALARLDEGEPGAALFAKAAREGWANSVICFDAEGRVLYPQISAQERDAEANAELLALENASDRSDANVQEIAGRLRARVEDYASAMPSAQRRFLMRELERFAPGTEFKTLPAEDLAARFLEAHPAPAIGETLRLSDLPGVWQVATPARRALALFTTANLRGRLDAFSHEPALSAGARIETIPPGEDALTDSTLVTTALGAQLPGWRLALSLDDRTLFDTAADKRVARYLWTGGIFIAAMSLLAFFVARGFGRQVQLTRLKNDLVATVSHELKTPLTAMRALVETLLDTEKFDEKMTGEYLQLLARENARLSRLIENFLTFSRLERNKFAFVFAEHRPEAVAEGAIAAMSERLHVAACHFENSTAPNLPRILGDADALVTALLNLLDNAWKYSGDDKRIALRTSARNGSVCFAVQDRGIGLSARDRKRVFERFYQADQRLARDASGCGLGLSIVQSIVEAHRGTVQVSSEPGHGSTFTIEIPAAR
jgi:signal transduction histidine kinase